MEGPGRRLALLDAAAPVAATPLEETLAKLRAAGWMVAVHNDYRQDGKLMTFWLFTRDGFAVKGEGETDAEALARVQEQIEGRVSDMRSGTRIAARSAGLRTGGRGLHGIQDARVQCCCRAEQAAQTGGHRLRTIPRVCAPSRSLDNLDVVVVRRLRREVSRGLFDKVEMGALHRIDLDRFFVRTGIDAALKKEAAEREPEPTIELSNAPASSALPRTPSAPSPSAAPPHCASPARCATRQPGATARSWWTTSLAADHRPQTSARGRRADARATTAQGFASWRRSQRSEAEFDIVYATPPNTPRDQPLRFYLVAEDGVLLYEPKDIGGTVEAAARTSTKKLIRMQRGRAR